MSDPWTKPDDWKPGDPLFEDVPLFGACEFCGTTWIAPVDRCPKCEEA